jgi:hypothetical protein
LGVKLGFLVGVQTRVAPRTTCEKTKEITLARRTTKHAEFK